MNEQDWEHDDWEPQEIVWIMIVAGAWSAIMLCVGMFTGMLMSP